ncbi:MAG: hypothetical protein ACLGI2_16940 [Acidimicrobiia bacterium]
MTTLEGPRHLMMQSLATSLADRARAAARDCRMHTSSWHFYHGVEAAATHVLHPETAAVREGTSWIDREGPSFREGFTKASTLLAGAAAMREPPLQVTLPEPDMPT